MAQPLEIPRTQTHDTPGEDDSSLYTVRNNPTSDLIRLLLEKMEAWVQLVERDPETPYVASENETNILHWIEIHQQVYLDTRNNISDLEEKKLSRDLQTLVRQIWKARKGHLIRWS